MAKLDPNVLVLDVESTCWEPPSAQPANEISEVIEIGIAVVDTQKLEIVTNSSIIIRPQKSKVSGFCTQLTTLTQEYVDQGTTFQAAIETLRKTYKSNDRVFVSWGDYDRKMFERNCRDYDVKYPFGPRHMNLRNTFTMLHGLSKEPGMDAALELLGIKLDGTHHRGVDDARNIANILIHTLKKFRATDLNIAMEEELNWRHKQDADNLEHSKELEVQKNELLKRLKNETT
jgi:inhibitor of KinA sporulation pathway (predicted exonuclease)